MPLNIDIVQILLHVLNFVILAGGLSLLLYKPVRKFMDERRAEFDRQVQENRKAAAENEKLKKEYEDKIAASDDEIARIHKAAEKEAAEAAKTFLDSAKQKADEIICAAEAEAELRKGKILESAQTEIGELVLEATQKLLAAPNDPQHTQALYDEFIQVASHADGDKRR